MKKVFVILGITSIFATCNKTASLKLDASKSIGALSCHWWQVSGPSTIIFDNPNSLIVNITTKNPIEGLYIIGLAGLDSNGHVIDTLLNYVLPQKKK